MSGDAASNAADLILYLLAGVAGIALAVWLIEPVTSRALDVEIAHALAAQFCDDIADDDPFEQPATVTLTDWDAELTRLLKGEQA